VAMPVVNAAGVTATSTVNFAAAGFDGGTNTITAQSFGVGGGNNDGNNGNLAILTLGTRNTIHADTVNIGGYAAAGTVLFPAGLVSPSLTLRGTDGTSAVTTVKVGETSSGARSGSGTLNLTGGELDARVTNLTIGRHIAGANLADTSSVTMPAGTLVVENLALAEKVNNGTPTLTSTFTQEGGDVSAVTITLGNGGPQEARLLPTYRLWGGTLAATTIQAGGGSFAANSSRNLILRGGVLENQPGADLAISGITVTVAGNTTTIVGPTAGQKVTLASNVNYSARLNSAAGTSGALVVEGPLDLSAQPAFSIFDDAPGDATLLAPGTKLKLIDYSLGTLTGTFAGLNDGATVTVTKGAVTNTFVIDYDDLGGTAVTLTVPDTGNDYTSWAVDKGIPGEPFDGDFDHDGISNGMEYALGKDPKAPSQPAGQFSGNTITFAKGADAIANRDVSWVIETSPTLAPESWTPEVTQEAGDPATVISYSFTPASPVRKFARLRVEQK
ncbi:MAG: hypothetical protein MUF04_14440, partial [Akkermansiaceae bacterium]|nr:hypothetical protein [Akkermansiaceae bacterium]